MNATTEMRRFKNMSYEHNDAMVLQLRAEGYSAYAEVDRDTEGSVSSEHIITSAPFSLVLLIAGHGCAYIPVS